MHVATMHGCIMVMMPLPVRLGFGIDLEAGAGERAVRMRQQPASRPRNCLRRLDHRRAVFRKSVQQAGDEHVAGGPAERVEMDMPHRAQVLAGETG